MLITSVTNNKVKQWTKYKNKKYRDLDDRFMIEGMHLIEEAHKAKIIESIIILQGATNPYPQYEYYEVSENVMDKLTMHVSNEKIMAVCHKLDYELNINDHKVILLDGLQDPGNIGTIIRTAYSFGYDKVILSDNSVDLYNDKLIRSTQGAMFHIPVIQNDLKAIIKSLKKQNFTIYATTLTNAKPLSNVINHGNIALIFGNEGNGISKEIIDMADQNIIIEMVNFESLNVAIAASICMYKFK